MKDKIKVYAIGGLAILLLIVIFYLFNRVQTLSNSKNTILGTTTNATTQPTAIPTLKPKETVKLSTPDPDPVISCNVNTNCGGGTRQLKKSICTNSICCQIGSNWYFYEDKSKCRPDQDTYNNQNSGVYIPPTYTFTPAPVINAPAPTVDYAALNQKNIELRSDCLGSVATYCREELARLNASSRDLGLSSKISLGNDLKNKCDQMQKDCEYKYPVN